MHLKLFIVLVFLPAFLVAQKEISSSYVKQDTLIYRECGLILHEAGEGLVDTIAEVKFIRYPNFSTDTSNILSEANEQVHEWVLEHAEGMDDQCSEDLRAFADEHRTGGPFIIYIDHQIGINKNGLFSVQLISNKEPCCGVSGLTNTTRCWNLDLQKGRAMKLEDVILPEKKKAFFKLLNKREIEQSLYPDSAGIEKAFDILIEQEKLRVFFNEQWGGMKYYIEVEVRYLQHQHLFQQEFLDRIELDCRVRENIVEGRRIYTMVNEPPVYPGGNDALLRLVRRELNYTDMFTSPNTYVSFVVETNGWISNAQVIKAPSPQAEKEALRFLKRMDRWTSGKCRGKEVPVLFSMPINTGN